MTTSSLVKRIRKAKRIYIIGNGGSYANAMHIANDLIACGIRAYTMDPASLTASANDHGWDTVFSLWIGNVGEEGDLLIAMSGSGKSRNILNAVETAKLIGMDVERVFGAPHLGMQDAEEAQIGLGHELMRELKRDRR